MQHDTKDRQEQTHFPVRFSVDHVRSRWFRPAPRILSVVELANGSADESRGNLVHPGDRRAALALGPCPFRVLLAVLRVVVVRPLPHFLGKVWESVPFRLGRP